MNEPTFFIRAFDSSSKIPLCLITLTVTLGPQTIETYFHIMSGKISYNLLLGRPWIHYMDVVPSTMHGYLKF